MLEAEILNTLVTIFTTALDGAYGALFVYTIGLLSFAGLMYFLLAIGQMTMHAYSLAALADVLWVVIKIGVVYFFAMGFYNAFWNVILPTFLQWGQEAGGGTFDLSAFLNPAEVLNTGLKAAKPMYDTLNNVGLFKMVDKPWTMAGPLIAYWLVVLSFIVIALHVIMTIIDIKLAIAAGAVLFPWALLSQTSILAELSLSWITAGVVRVMLTALMMGVGMELFPMANLGVSPATAGPDPKFHSQGVLVAVAFVFAVLAWVLPNRAATLAGRGMALALSGTDLVGGGMAAWSAGGATVAYGTRAVQAVAQGGSQMLQAMRRAA
jgi:type IV secretory pathway TrbL component